MHGKQNFILKEHIDIGREYYETKQSHNDTYARRVAIGNGAEPSRDEYALFVMLTVQCLMNDLFRANRRQVREEFAEYFGYLFMSWD